MNTISADPEPDLTPVAVDPLADQLARLRALLARKRQIEAEADEIRAAIQDALGDYEIGTVHGLPAVTWTHHIRHAFDQTAFKKAEPELHAVYLKATPYRRFTVIEDTDD
jgi:predicted phage-related endonuclease